MCKLQRKYLLLTNAVHLVSLCYVSCTHVSCSPIMLHFLILYCCPIPLLASMQSGVPIHYLVIPLHRAMFPFTICDSKIIWSGYLQGCQPNQPKLLVQKQCLWKLFTYRYIHLRLNILHSIYFLCICDLICQLFWKEEWKIYFCLV